MGLLWGFWMSPERLDTAKLLWSGAKEGRSLSVMMPSLASYSCRHCDADGSYYCRHWDLEFF